MTLPDPEFTDTPGLPMTDPNTPDAKRVAEIAERATSIAAPSFFPAAEVRWLLSQHAALQRMLAESDAVRDSLSQAAADATARCAARRCATMQRDRDAAEAALAEAGARGEFFDTVAAEDAVAWLWEKLKPHPEHEPRTHKAFAVIRSVVADRNRLNAALARHRANTENGQ